MVVLMESRDETTRKTFAASTGPSEAVTTTLGGFDVPGDSLCSILPRPPPQVNLFQLFGAAE